MEKEQFNYWDLVINKAGTYLVRFQGQYNAEGFFGPRTWGDSPLPGNKLWRTSEFTKATPKQVEMFGALNAGE